MKFVNHVDVDNRSALHWAVTKGSVEVITCLLGVGANSKLADCQGNTPLHLACVLTSNNCVYPEAVEVLTRFSSDAMFLSNQDSLTPLHIAAERGHVSIVKVLLEKDAENMKKSVIFEKVENLEKPEENSVLDENDDKSDTLSENHEKCSEYTEVSILYLTDDQGRTAAHWAALSGHLASPDIIMLLLRHAPDLANLQDYHGRTILHCVANNCDLQLSNKNLEYTYIQYILNNENFDIDQQDSIGNTPLHWAYSLTSLSLASVLLNNGADVNVLNYEGKTALNVALEKQAESYDLCDFDGNGNFEQSSKFEHSDGSKSSSASKNDQMVQLLIDYGGLTSVGVMHAAAICLQSFFRGYLVRKNFDEKYKPEIKVEVRDFEQEIDGKVVVEDEKPDYDKIELEKYRNELKAFLPLSTDNLITSMCFRPDSVKNLEILANQHKTRKAIAKLDKIKIIQRWWRFVVRKNSN